MQLLSFSWRLLSAISLLISALPVDSQPIRLHPDNPHYFLWRGQPTILITSAEHYGVLLNLDFDYRRYLDTLAADGLNNTRTFSGAYVEPEGAFNIARNTLAPLANRFICPWARSDQPGYAKGGNRFDLTRWDEAYFRRLLDFVSYAEKRGVVVEFCLFCPMYEEKQWHLSPMNARNNINDIGNLERTEVYTLDQNGALLAVQEALTRKIVTTLNPFDNVLIEICNEPYFGGVTLAWQHRIADVIVETERSLPKQHLITQNIANNQAKIVDPHSAVSVFNFHYATPPDTVAMNYHLNKVVGDNETGFRGTNDAPYRTEAWDFILAGGGLFNHLDYSFVAGHEDGTFSYPKSQPGGGNPGFRQQMRILSEFMHGFDFLRMQPDNSIIRGGIPAGGTARALVNRNQEIAIYVRNQGSTGPWSARWTGFLVAPTSGDYTFHTFSNDGIRLWVNDHKLIEDWTDHSEKEDTGTITLKQDHPYPITLEYFYNGGQGVTKLWWTPPGGTKEPVPANALRLPDNGWGLRGQYFVGTDLRRSWTTRDDGMVNFSWGIRPPVSGITDEESTALEIELRPGSWRAEWVDTKTGAVHDGGVLTGGGVRRISAPAYEIDVALRLIKQ